MNICLTFREIKEKYDWNHFLQMFKLPSDLTFPAFMGGQELGWEDHIGMTLDQAKEIGYQEN